MVTNLHLVGNVLGNKDSTDGEAVSEGLGSGENIRVSLLGKNTVGPESTSSAHTALNLIVDQHGSDLSASLSQGDEELLSTGHDTTLTLDRLDDNTASLLVHQVVDSGKIVVGAGLESRNHGRKGLLVLGVGSRGQASHCSAVEAILERDNLVLIAGGVDHLASLSGKLDSGLVGFGSRVAHKHGSRVVHSTRLESLLYQKLRQGASPGVVVKVRRMDESLGLQNTLAIGYMIRDRFQTHLIGDDVGKLRVAVAETVHGNTSSEVEVFSVLDIVEV